MSNLIAKQRPIVPLLTIYILFINERRKKNCLQHCSVCYCNCFRKYMAILLVLVQCICNVWSTDIGRCKSHLATISQSQNIIWMYVKIVLFYFVFDFFLLKKSSFDSIENIQFIVSFSVYVHVLCWFFPHWHRQKNRNDERFLTGRF